MLSLLFSCKLPFSVNFNILTTFHWRTTLCVQKVQPGKFSGCDFVPIFGKLVTHFKTGEWTGDYQQDKRYQHGLCLRSS